MSPLFSSLRFTFPRLYLGLTRLRLSLGHKLKTGTQSPTSRYIAAYGWRVYYGPFAGMVHNPGGASNFPQLLGCYEQEIYPALERLLKRDSDLVVNIGAASGYYAVGIAMKNADKRVIAYELGEELQKLCATNASLNGVGDRVDVRGECDIDELANVLTKRSLVLCDCEGCEMALMDPERLPALRTSDLLIELHDFVNPAISKTLIERFTPTHEVEIIDSVRKSADAFPALHILTADQKTRALDEHRPGPMQWLVLTAKSA